MTFKLNDDVFARKSRKYRKGYIESLNSLYFDKPVNDSPKPVKKIKNADLSEAQEQILLSSWLTKNHIIHSASANGGKRNLFEAVKLKKMGVSPGFPDIQIPFPNGKYYGLFLEMKKKKGSVTSKCQKEWIRFLNLHGYHAEVVYGFDHGKEVVKRYFNLSSAA